MTHSGDRRGWLRRTRRLRLAALLLVLGGVLLVWLAKQTGHLAYVHSAPFTGQLTLEHGVEVEQVDLLQPAARLVVARVPRGRGLGLRAVLLSADRQELQRIGPVAERLDALVAVNGDYHRLGGFCFATTFSSLIDQGRTRVLGSPFSYAATFWLDTEGVPQVGRLDLRCKVLLPSGRALKGDLFLNLEQGDLVLVDRPPSGSWTAKGYVGLSVAGSFESQSLRVTSPASTEWSGTALLTRVGGPHEEDVRRLRPGDTLRLRLEGEHAGHVALALGTGPRLLEGGAVHPDAQLDNSGWVNRLGRTAIGFNDEMLFLVTTLQMPHAGLSMLDLATALQRLGCQEAINLDGGPSSTLWAGGRVLNVPVSDGDTPVASALCVVPPGEGTPLR